MHSDKNNTGIVSASSTKTSSTKTIGVLALQGGVTEHVAILDQLGVNSRLVRLPEHLEGLDGLIFPGGESTTMSKLMQFNVLVEPLQQALGAGLPAFGTCAGMILLAKEVENTRPDAVALGALDITVRRNAFGRQVDSFETDLKVTGVDVAADEKPLHAAFIRAPWVARVGESVRVLSEVTTVEGDTAIVAVANDTVLATSFHPESTGETRIHEFFLQEFVG